MSDAWLAKRRHVLEYRATHGVDGRPVLVAVEGPTGPVERLKYAIGYRWHSGATGPTAWMTDAACKGINPGVFHPETGKSAADAKAICERCPVARACGDYATDNPTACLGVWGGLTEAERRHVRARR